MDFLRNERDDELHYLSWFPLMVVSLCLSWRGNGLYVVAISIEGLEHAPLDAGFVGGYFTRAKKMWLLRKVLGI